MITSPYEDQPTRRITVNLGEADLHYILALYPEHGNRDVILANLFSQLVDACNRAGLQPGRDGARFAAGISGGQYILGRSRTVADSPVVALGEQAAPHHD